MKYHNYVFLCGKASNTEKYKREFLRVLTADSAVIANTYAVLGFKDNINILVWFQSDSPEANQDAINRLMHTGIGRGLEINRTLFGMTRPTQYSSRSPVEEDTNRKGSPYLIIYPFTKTKEWHFLPLEKRRSLMNGHIAIGKRYPEISQLLLYSYGVDDQEFIVSYETEDLSLFQSLVMELRADKVRAHILSDTPIFTCIYKSPEEILNYL